MTLKNRWMGMGLAAIFAAVPAKGLARNGADDLIPQAPKPEKTGLARHGADDVLPQFPQPEPEKTGLA